MKVTKINRVKQFAYDGQSSEHARFVGDYTDEQLDTFLNTEEGIFFVETIYFTKKD